MATAIALPVEERLAPPEFPEAELPSFAPLPKYEDLPETDGSIVENFQEHPQGLLLTDSIKPVLEKRFPDGLFCIGQDSGIYWRPIPDEPLEGCKSPDWFLILGVPQNRDGQFRRSYVLWEETVAPLIVVEFVSKSGKEERDRTPMKGKFWVYEQGIRIPYYAIFDGFRGKLDVFETVEARYQAMKPNERGHFAIKPLGLELGLWLGSYIGSEATWLRWYDENGVLLPCGHERADAERQRADAIQLELDRLREIMRARGIDPD